jgi:flavin reductase (DIM6/NTAB) family NADH-FMN oxidoreductase RutF
MRKISKRPWNIIDLPVYSLSVRCDEDENMNIATYVSAISLKPKKMIVSIYKNTKTLILAEKNPHFIIQLLSVEQINLVRLLGKNSGFKKNKIQYLTKKNLLITWKGFKILKEAVSIIEVKAFEFVDASDHVVFLCDVVAYRNLFDKPVLRLDHLRKKNIISC